MSSTLKLLLFVALIFGAQGSRLPTQSALHSTTRQHYASRAIGDDVAAPLVERLVLEVSSRTSSKQRTE